MTLDWVDKFGKRYPLQRMERRHMFNIINMILEGRMRRPGCSGFTNAEWVRILRCELTRRTRYEGARNPK